MFKKSLFQSVAATLVGMTVGSSATAEESHSQTHYSEDTQKSFAGPSDLFTGEVQVDIVFPSNESAHYSGAYVTFSPGARTAWHEHPAGQHMVVTQGTALTGTRDGHVIKFHEGEAVWCPPDLDHWHGTTPDAPMKHFVVTASKDGENVIWKEKVSNEDYEKALAKVE
ncbi:cupin [Salinivibrio sp. PR6]|uniref:Cupin n=1 Tax=Salinivibrio siamensis TaxID=414286 RepID=A0ABX3KDY4_9GAMM|nr:MULTISPECIES: cupin domain-containing protein [Salinivibrio]OOE67157.1 cupin [Salinivibrio sp. IB868]OOE77292.1 cupin [Salinivibrio sp. IB870]OOE81650.1 cupin [Salinivibrio sp. ML198]OOE84665.1 cupin [Salinivibrio sp. PR6]OOE87178.1 cupin [Salinivibrio siamensis]